MSDFTERPKRSIELPLGCKDLIDIAEIRDWKKAAYPHWPKLVREKLAYMEGYLGEIFRSAGHSYLAGVSRRLDLGWITVIEDTSLTSPVAFAQWHGADEKQAVQTVFDEAGLAPISGPLGRWKTGHSLNYPLPADPAEAARLIGDVFRAGYNLGNSTSINISYQKAKAA